MMDEVVLGGLCPECSRRLKQYGYDKLICAIGHIYEVEE